MPERPPHYQVRWYELGDYLLDAALRATFVPVSIHRQIGDASAVKEEFDEVQAHCQH